MHRIRFAALLPILLMLLAVRTAAAQGTQGLLAPPLGTPELDRAAARLGLSDAQRQAVDGLHRRYLEECRALRDGEIGELLERQRRLDSGIMPDRAVVTDFFERWDRVRARAARLDDRLFEEIGALLSDEQAPQLEIVRLQRMRDRQRQADMMMLAGDVALVELRELVDELRLPAGDAARAIDAELLAYERRLVATIEKLGDRSRRIILSMLDRLEAAGITGGTAMNDEATMARVQEITMSFWQNEMAEARKLAAETRTLAERTAATIASMLVPDDARRFGRAVRRTIDPQLGWGFDDFNGVHDPIGSILRLDDLSAEERSALVGLQAELDPVVDQALTRAHEAIRERADSTSPFDFDPEAWQETERRVEEQRLLAQAKTREAVEAAKGALGERWDALFARAATAAAEPGAGGGAATVVAMPEEVVEWSGDWSIARRLGPREARQLRRLLSLSDGEAAILDGLLDEHRSAFDAWPDRTALQEAQAKAWVVDPESGMATPSPDAPSPAELAALRRRIPDELDAIDASLFEGVELAFGDEHRRPLIALARLGRRIDVRRSTTFSWMGDGRNQEDEVNLVGTAIGALPPDALAGEAAAALRAHAEAVLPLLAARFAAAVHVGELQDEWQRESMLAQRDGVPMDWQTFQARMTPAGAALADADAAIAAEVRRGLEAVSAHLDAESLETLRRAHRRAAYPTVYDVALDPTPLLDRAAALPDLTDEQRRGLAELRLEAVPEFERLSDAMIAALAPIPTLAPDDWSARQAVEREFERVQFDRDELCHRTASRLRRLLGEAQAAALGLAAPGATALDR